MCHTYKLHNTKPKLIKMNKLLSILIIIILSIDFSYSQPWQIDWQQCFGGTENDYATDIVEKNGSYLIIGVSQSSDGDISFNHGGDDGWLVKIDVQGNLLWEKTFGGTLGDGFFNLLESTTGEYYLIGGSNSSNGDISNDPYPNTTDFWIVKIDSTGNIIWDRIVGGNAGDFIVNGILTSDNGIIAIGYSGSFDGDISTHYGQYDMWMIKLNSEGETEWDFTIGNSAMDYPGAIIETTDGGYLVGGSSEILEGGNLNCETNGLADAVIIKLDSMRNIEWQQCYGGSYYDGATVLLELEDGYLFAGYAGSNDGNISGWHGEMDIWVVRLDFWGNVIWQKCLGGGASESSYYLLQTEDMGFYVVGVTQSTNGDITNNHSHPGKYDIWVVKLTGDGELQWQQCFGGDRDERIGSGVLYKGNNDLIIAGQSEKESGDVLCNFHGWLERDDYWVFEITMPDTTTVTNMLNETGFVVYPNPANDYVVFEFSVPGSEFRVRESDQIRLTNTFGQQVALLPVKSEKIVWDTRNIPNGIYFYSLEIERKVLCGKIVVQD